MSDLIERLRTIAGVRSDTEAMVMAQAAGRIEQLEAVVEAALKNADRLPFVMGVQFKDFNAMRAALEKDNE